MIAKREVDDAALARRHGRELVWGSRPADFFGGNIGGQAQLFQAHGPVVHAVEADFLMLIAREAQHPQRTQFDGTKHFGTAFQEQSRVWAGKFNQDLRALPVPLFGNWRINRDAVFQAQATMSDDAAQEFVDLIGGGDFVGNGH